MRWDEEERYVGEASAESLLLYDARRTLISICIHPITCHGTRIATGTREYSAKLR